MTRRLIAVSVAVLLLFGCSGDEDRLKTQRDIARLQEQIYVLERTQTELKNQVQDSLKDVNKKLQDRSDQADIQEQVRSLKDVLNQYDARFTDITRQIDDLGRSNVQVNTAPIQPVEGQEPVPIESVSGEVVEQQFNKAYLDYNRGKYDVAALGFQGVLDSFPGSPFTESCYYYLGRSYIETKQYEKAVEFFGLIGEKYPSGDYIRQANYYEGQCYFYLNKHMKAVLTLRDLIKNHPGTQEANLAQQFLKKAGYEQ